MFFLIIICCSRLQVTWFDCQQFLQRGELMANESSARAMIFSAGDSVLGWGQFLGSHFPALDIQAEMFHHISETVRPSTGHEYRKFEHITTKADDHQCARRRNSSYDYEVVRK